MDRFSASQRAKSRQRRWMLVGLILSSGSGTLPGCVANRRQVESPRTAATVISPNSHAAESPLGSSPVAPGELSMDDESSGGASHTDVTPAAFEDRGNQAAPRQLNRQSAQADFRTLVTQASPFAATADGLESEPAANANQTVPSESDLLGEKQSVEFFVQQALANHPKLQAARQRVAAAGNVMPQVSALPDPQFSNTFWPLHDQALQTAAGRMGNQMSLSQQIPYPEKLSAKARIASREVQMAQAEADAIAREITESVRLAYYEVWFNARAIEILEETKLLVDDLTEVAEARYRAGGSQQDVLRAQLENDRLDDQLVGLRKQKAVAQADLAALLQQPVTLVPEAGDVLDVGTRPTDIQSLIALAEQCNPTLRGLAWEISRDRERQQLACLQQYPDLSVGVHWGLVSDDHDVISPVANGHDNLSFTVGTSLPIWRDKINAGIREAGHRAASTTRRLDASRDEIHGQLRRLMAQADALIEQRDIYQERIVPRTEDTLKLAIADYRGERTDFYSLIETYRELLMFETQLARIEASLAGVVAQIDRAVGCPL